MVYFEQAGFFKKPFPERLLNKRQYTFILTDAANVHVTNFLNLFYVIGKERFHNF